MRRNPPSIRSEHALNAALLAHLRAESAPPTGPEDYALGEWQLHTHPDLMSRLRELSLDEPLRAAYGVPVVAPDGVAAAVALGMRVLLLRLPVPPVGLKAQKPVASLADHGWHAVDAWQSDLRTLEGDHRLMTAIQDAVTHTRSLVA